MQEACSEASDSVIGRGCNLPIMKEISDGMMGQRARDQQVFYGVNYRAEGDNG